jgi:RsiW-degrading membrane proteinase PrsW (M82 family)
MSPLGLAVAGLAFPGLLILAGVVTALRRRQPPVRFRTVALFLGLGVASLVLTGVWSLLAETWALGRVDPAFYYAVLTAALPEEGFRYLAIRLGLARRPRRGPVEAMLLGSLVGLALGALENAGYAADRGWEIGLARSVTSVPYHTLAGAALGGGVALAARTGRPWGLVVLAVLIIVHGLADWPVGGPGSGPPDGPLGEFVDTGWAGNIASLVAAVILTAVLARATRRAEAAAEPVSVTSDLSENKGPRTD